MTVFGRFILVFAPKISLKASRPPGFGLFCLSLGAGSNPAAGRTSPGPPPPGVVQPAPFFWLGWLWPPGSLRVSLPPNSIVVTPGGL